MDAARRRTGRPRSLLRRRGARSRGQGLVEFALVFPLFILLVMAIADLGLAVFAYNSITNAAREGARLAIVNQDSAKVTERATSQSSVARAPTVTVAFYRAAADGTPDTSTTCPIGAATYIAVGCLAVVTFEGDYEPITPIIGNVVFGGGVTFTAETVLPVEYSCPNSTQTAAQCPKQP
ncbi:MAG TPA: TadE/TadG family type IV pilus assembly protein [Candidatus Limnocylindrales bacterium]|nr:TadE/TadG family type IV pilus assembly protein [Candidatus Limnocylindrales bacterium]